MIKETRSLLTAAVCAAALTLSACGGSSSGSSTTSNGSASNTPSGSSNSPTTAFQGIPGPLDAIQNPLSDQVLGQLSGAVMGTPLEAVIDCVDQAVVHDLLDTLDVFALALQAIAAGADPQAAFTAAAAEAQAAITAFAGNLPGVLTGLAGEGCSNTGTSTASSSNPLAGTPLAPLGDALAPVLAAFPTAGDSNAADLQLTTLSALVTQLNQAFQQGLAMVPAEAQTAPVAGGLFATLSHALNNLDGTLQVVAIYDADAASQALTHTVDTLLKDVLTGVIPVKFIEEQAGQGPIVSSQIENGISQVTAALGQGLDPLLDAVLEQLLADALSPVMDPIENTLLPAILGPITDALAGGLGGSTGAGPTGTPLDAVLAPIMDALGGGLPTGGSSAGLTGTPLDLLLAPLTDAIDTGGVGACPLAATPLAPLCVVVDGLLGGNGLGDLVGLLGLGGLPIALPI